MSEAQVIICEKSPRWAVALRRACGKFLLPLVESRSLTQCARVIELSPSSLVVLEITTGNLEGALALMAHNSRLHPRVRFVAALTAETSGAEGLLREAGAIAAVPSTLAAAEVAELARRQVALCPLAKEDLRESIARRMPWPAYATAGNPAKS